ncbi:MAG TPA: hypothetical protein VGM68_09620 [Rhizomicrobium sp.]|jgi:hypothetical protein
MRIALVLAVFAASSLLSACAVVDAGATVVGAGARMVGTAASVTADVVTAPFGGSSDDKQAKKN